MGRQWLTEIPLILTITDNLNTFSSLLMKIVEIIGPVFMSEKNHFLTLKMLRYFLFIILCSLEIANLFHDKRHILSEMTNAMHFLQRGNPLFMGTGLLFLVDLGEVLLNFFEL